MAGYLDAVEAVRPAANVVASVPHSAVRGAVIGSARRRAGSAELARMQREVKAGLAVGARVVARPET